MRGTLSAKGNPVHFRVITRGGYATIRQPLTDDN
jgi:hypothetical protein